MLALIALLTVGSVAAVIDARTGRIPNWLTVPAALVGIVGHTVHGGAQGAFTGLCGLLVGAAIPWLLYRGTQGRAIGGGDVKLLGALGALGGPLMGLEIQLSAFVLLAVFASLKLAFQGALLKVWLGAFRILLRPVLPAKWRRVELEEGLTEMRMGPAIAAGILAVLLRNQLMDWLPWLL